MLGLLFFFKQKSAYEMRISDWSSDVCSSDLPGLRQRPSGIRDEQLVLQPDTRADRSVEEQGPLRKDRLPSAEAARRRSRAPASRTDRREADDADDGAGRVSRRAGRRPVQAGSLPLRSEEHTSELQSLMRISYAVFCLKKK